MTDPAASHVRSLVRRASPSLESMPYATLVVGFVNDGPEAVEIEAYDVVWPGGRFPVTDSKIALKRGEARDFTVRVPVSSGNIDALISNAGDAHIERLVTRPGNPRGTS